VLSGSGIAVGARSAAPLTSHLIQPKFDTSIHAEKPPAMPQIRMPMKLMDIEPRGG
jgi:hypothetical protein